MGQKKLGDGKTKQQKVDEGIIDARSVLKILVELAYRVSNGQLPPNMTRLEIKQWLKDNV
jgi:hypothetical protein